jgi:hypothetical protein
MYFLNAIIILLGCFQDTHLLKMRQYDVSNKRNYKENHCVKGIFYYELH